MASELLSLLSNNGQLTGRLAEAWLSADRLSGSRISLYEKGQEGAEDFFCTVRDPDGAATVRICIQRFQCSQQPLVLYAVVTCGVYCGRLSGGYAQYEQAGASHLCGCDIAVRISGILW